MQRTVKFAKYLPHFDWSVSVLTASNPSVPVFDETLIAEIPEETVIERARSWEPSYASKSKLAGANNDRPMAWGRAKSLLRSVAMELLQPDAQVLWMPNALRIGRRLLSALPHDSIVATGPPFSAFLIGARLSRRFNLPLVLDYRDEWDISNAHWENRKLSRFSLSYQQSLQGKLLRSATCALATTEASAERIAKRVSCAGSAASVYCLYNGYDPDDFIDGEQNSSRESNDRFRLVYTGTLWNLTSIAPLVSAIELLYEQSAATTAQLELEIVGRCTEEQEIILTRLTRTNCNLVTRGYVPHRDAIGIMCRSDCLCILLSDTADAGRVVPAKLFEYLATRRPMLMIAPPGESRDLTSNFPHVRSHDPSDVAGIAKTLHSMVTRRELPQGQNGLFEIEQFSRKTQAGRLADLLLTTVKSKR